MVRETNRMVFAALLRGGRVLLIRERGSNIWTLPGGVVERTDRSDEEALRRIVGTQFENLGVTYIEHLVDIPNCSVLDDASPQISFSGYKGGFQPEGGPITLSGAAEQFAIREGSNFSMLHDLVGPATMDTTKEPISGVAREMLRRVYRDR